MADQTINVETLFQAILAEKQIMQASLQYEYQSAGEAAIAGREISEYSKGSVREYKGRIAELDWCVKEMQRIVRDAE